MQEFTYQCAWCKQVLTPNGYCSTKEAEKILGRVFNDTNTLSHGICPPCMVSMDNRITSEMESGYVW